MKNVLFGTEPCYPGFGRPMQEDELIGFLTKEPICSRFFLITGLASEP
jgi:hypothetical protein